MAEPAPPAPPAVDVYVSAGSNVDPEENLRLACRELARRFGPLAMSGVYRNPPVGFTGDDFLNLVLRFRTAEPPAAVVAELERLHVLAGRVRGRGALCAADAGPGPPAVRRRRHRRARRSGCPARTS